MGKTKTPATPKARKPKTQAQKAKAEANIKAAAARLARLQEQQRLVNAKRAEGVVGTDKTILRLVYAETQAQERSNESAKAIQYVNNMISGPHGEKILNWIGDVKGDPCKIAQIVKNYVATQGWKDAM